MDGLTATMKIREKEKGTRLHMPIIAMTAHAMKGDRERCIEAGMDGYVSKPISSEELKEAIASALHRRGDAGLVTRVETKQEEAPRPPQPSVIAWDMGKTLEQLGGDEELFREVVEIFLDDVPKHLTSLRQAIEDGDGEAIERTAHILKGELGYLGISEISRKAREMEAFGQKSDLLPAAGLYATLEPELSEVLISMRRMVGAKPKVELVTGSPGANQ
jgi:HPt (histidine-containing phosphotransfer) domain-containing protein